MSAFTAEELAYLHEGRKLARLATVGADGTPHVVPVGWSLGRTYARSSCARTPTATLPAMLA